MLTPAPDTPPRVLWIVANQLEAQRLRATGLVSRPDEVIWPDRSTMHLLGSTFDRLVIVWPGEVGADAYYHDRVTALRDFLAPLMLFGAEGGTTDDTLHTNLRNLVAQVNEERDR